MAFPVPHRNFETRRVTAEQWNEQIADNLNDLHAALALPGEVRMVAFASPPTGWLTCNGQSVSRTTYAALFAAIGTTYGNTDVVTFQVPDLRTRIPIGASGTVALGATAGAWDHVHTGPSHTHPIANGGAHQHTTTGVASANPEESFTVCVATPSVGVSSWTHDHLTSGATSNDGEHNHGANTGAGGTGNTGAANPPVMGLTFIISTGGA